MQKTSELYQELLASEHRKETRLSIGETGVLITKQGEDITFGGVSILVGATGADGGYDESILVSMETDGNMFGNQSPAIGACVSTEIEVEMLKPISEIPPMARMVPYVRITDGVRYSEWIQKGVYYIDTREENEHGPGLKTITIHGYDDMLKAEQDYPSSTLEWPARDIDVVREIAAFIGITIDPRTIKIINRGENIQYPAGYSCRDVLGYIAGMYAGCFIMSDLGELRLIKINGIPKETRYLVENNGAALTFGGDHILV